MAPAILKNLKDWVNCHEAGKETMHMGNRNYDNVGNTFGYTSKTVMGLRFEPSPTYL